MSKEILNHSFEQPMNTCSNEVVRMMPSAACLGENDLVGLIGKQIALRAGDRQLPLRFLLANATSILHLTTEKII